MEEEKIVVTAKRLNDDETEYAIALNQDDKEGLTRALAALILTFQDSEELEEIWKEAKEMTKNYQTEA